MFGAIVITVLALTSAAIVLGVLLAVNRPAEGWRAWFTETARAWRSDELSSQDLTTSDDVGGLRTLAQLSEPGSAYVTVEDYTWRRQHFETPQ